MAVILHNPNGLQFGMCQILPLCGFPKGKVRIRIRSNDFVKIRIRTESGIREFYPRESNGVWIPYLESGQNERTKPEEQ